MIKSILLVSILFYLDLLIAQENCNNARIKYLEANLDVKKANLDPWLHYQNYGKKEGRTWPNCNEGKVLVQNTSDSLQVYNNLIDTLTKNLNTVNNSLLKYYTVNGKEVKISRYTIETYKLFSKCQVAYFTSDYYYKHLNKNGEIKIGGKSIRLFSSRNITDNLYFVWYESTDLFIVFDFDYFRSVADNTK